MSQTIEVDREALRRVLVALSGQPHLIAELQATRGLPTLPRNPIDILVDNFMSEEEAE